MSEKALIARWYSHSGFIVYECSACKKSGNEPFSFETTTVTVLQLDYDQVLTRLETDHAQTTGCKGRLEFVMAKRTSYSEHEKEIPKPKDLRPWWRRFSWRRTVCRFRKHVPEEFVISACTPIAKGIRCKRCGEQWPQCEWCGVRPATSVVQGSGEDVCRHCVGV